VDKSLYVKAFLRYYYGPYSVGSKVASQIANEYCEFKDKQATQQALEFEFAVPFGGYHNFTVLDVAKEFKERKNNYSAYEYACVFAPLLRLSVEELEQTLEDTITRIKIISSKQLASGLYLRRYSIVYSAGDAASLIEEVAKSVTDTIMRKWLVSYDRTLCVGVVDLLEKE
jgi:hypothetical protein